VDEKHFIQCAVLSSIADETPEGKSIVELGQQHAVNAEQLKKQITSSSKFTFIKFSAETRSSGIDCESGRIRKGAFDTIKKIAEQAGNSFPNEVVERVNTILTNGGTPLVVSENEKIVGVVELQDIIKTGIRERFERSKKFRAKSRKIC
jgi:K+-transporting ATPase ATPase B chain